MPRKLPDHAEFEVGQNHVLHKPTNARWTAYSGQAAAHIFTRGHLGSVLPNGDDYDEERTTRMAVQLLAQRLKK
jgi:hypothetical protein